MAVEREYVGIEPFFAAGAYLAASANLDFQQIFHLAAFAQTAVITLLIYTCLSKVSFSHRTYKILILAIALCTGAFCGMNARILNLGHIENPTGLQSFFRNIGTHLQDSIDNIPFTNCDTNSLLKALLSGNRGDIPVEITTAFKRAGASHILALSGLHLGIIYALISKITSLMGGTRAAKISRCFLNLSTCTVYALATGASASIMRALTFIIINEIGRLCHRPASLERVLRKTLMINLIIRPESILEIGFQLSYAAMAGIAWIHPFLKEAWPENEGRSLMKKIWDTASVSISCQVTTAPLAYLYFGTFPVYFLLTNLLALPLTGIIIPAAAITSALDTIGICPPILIHITEKATACLIFVLETISQM